MLISRRLSPVRGVVMETRDRKRKRGSGQTGDGNFSWKTLMCVTCSGGTRGEIRPCPPSKLAMEFAPLGGRKSNDSIVNLSRFKDFGPPYRCRLRIWPPYGKIPH